MDPWGRLFLIAKRQHGVVARRQALRLGISAAAFTRRVRREHWPQLHRGVYLVPSTPLGVHARVSAALLAVGDHAIASGDTALFLHGVTRVQPSHVALAVPHDRRAPRLRGVVVTRTRTLVEADRMTVEHLSCAAAPRAFADAAPVHEQGDLRVLLIDARQRNVVEPADVLDRVARLPVNVPGRARLLRAALDVDAVGADSVLTDQVHRRLLEDGLRPDPHPAPIAVGRSRRLHPDITFSDERVCIECDSLAHHGTQRDIDLDHRKNEAYQAAGWICLRIGWRRFDHDWPGFVVAVRRAIDAWPQRMTVGSTPPEAGRHR